jgi:8-oxo-dGTP pyrophosphatase MutT (NUDIX family)
MEHKQWKTLQSEVVYDNRWITVRHEQVIAPTGNKGIYGMVHYKHYALGIIPLDAQLNTWLIGQRRYPIDQYSWEIPEGGGKVGKDPLLAARRELAEEAGLKADHWLEIQRLHLSNSVSDELGIIYLATGLSYTDSQPDETEELTIRKLSFDEAFDMAWRGELTDTMTVAGIFRVKRMLEMDMIRY